MSTDTTAITEPDSLPTPGRPAIAEKLDRFEKALEGLLNAGEAHEDRISSLEVDFVAETRASRNAIVDNLGKLEERLERAIDRLHMLDHRMTGGAAVDEETRPGSMGDHVRGLSQLQKGTSERVTKVDERVGHAHQRIDGVERILVEKSTAQQQMRARINDNAHGVADAIVRIAAVERKLELLPEDAHDLEKLATVHEIALENGRRLDELAAQIAPPPPTSITDLPAEEIIANAPRTQATLEALGQHFDPNVLRLVAYTRAYRQMVEAHGPIDHVVTQLDKTLVEIADKEAARS